MIYLSTANVPLPIYPQGDTGGKFHWRGRDPLWQGGVGGRQEPGQIDVMHFFYIYPAFTLHLPIMIIETTLNIEI